MSQAAGNRRHAPPRGLPDRATRGFLGGLLALAAGLLAMAVAGPVAAAADRDSGGRNEAESPARDAPSPPSEPSPSGPPERIDPVFPDLHAAAWSALHGRNAPEAMRWHPAGYRDDAEPVDVTHASIAAPASPRPESGATPPAAGSAATVAMQAPQPQPQPQPHAAKPAEPAVAARLEAVVAAARIEAAPPADPPVPGRPPGEAGRHPDKVAVHGSCSVHSNDAESRARLKACLRAAFHLAQAPPADRAGSPRGP
ncbi:MAG TPA: hypothetical protein VMU33_05785 [Burkholderiaceae bacterium]|nr:hypothetical protein [Burkholderiaceae bacterium]